MCQNRNKAHIVKTPTTSGRIRTFQALNYFD